MKSSRKVLRVSDGEFLMNLYPDKVETCNHIKDAMDLSVLDITSLNNLLNALYNVGYHNMKVMEVKR